MLRAALNGAPLPPSADEGEEHAVGERPSHAAAMLAQPPPLPPQQPSGMEQHGLSLLRSLRQPRQPPSWWGPRRAKRQASGAERSAARAAAAGLPAACCACFAQT